MSNRPPCPVPTAQLHLFLSSCRLMAEHKMCQDIPCYPCCCSYCPSWSGLVWSCLSYPCLVVRIIHMIQPFASFGSRCFSRCLQEEVGFCGTGSIAISYKYSVAQTSATRRKKSTCVGSWERRTVHHVWCPLRSYKLQRYTGQAHAQRTVKTSKREM